MENKKRANLIKGTLVAGALLSVTALSAIPNSSSLFNYRVLGSGAEVRSEILHSDASRSNNFEAKCGEKTETKAESEVKSTEAKCGEGKCGEGDKKVEGKQTKKEAKAAKAKSAETETKAKEAKCGEGKCGEKKGGVE